MFVEGFGNKACGFPKVNLNLVARLEPRDRDGRWSFVCYDTNGNNIGEVSAFDVPDGPSGVVPNITPIIAVIFTDGGEFRRTHILAWRVVGDGTALPVFADRIESNCVYCYEETIGGVTTYRFPDEARFENFEEALAYGCDSAKDKSEDAHRRFLESYAASESGALQK